MSDSFNIYCVPVDAFEGFLDGLTDTGKSVFRSYFHHTGTYEGKTVVFAIDDASVQDWLWDDGNDYDGDGSADTPYDWIMEIGKLVDVTVVSGSIGGNPILE